MAENMNEIAIEWEKGREKATISAYNNSKIKGKIMKYVVSHPKDVDVHENMDGSIVAHVPVKWVKISPPRNVSEEQAKAAGERLKKMHENRKN